MKEILNELKNGLIVSCYADQDYNIDSDDSNIIVSLAKAVVAGGAKGIRVNLKHVQSVAKSTSVPIVGIQKIYNSAGEMRITPTMKEVRLLKEAGANIIAIDATKRQRWDENSLEEFVKKIKSEFDICVIGDVSTYEEGINAAKAGVDAVGTTLSGYTEYSDVEKQVLGSIPPKEPNFKIIRDLSSEIPIPVIAEGRFWYPKQVGEAFSAGAYAVVVGTAISNPKKVTEHFVFYTP